MNEDPDPRLKRVADALNDARRELIDISRELSPNFGDGLKDQAAAWA